MLHKTQGIVFRFTKYGETSIIVNIFTELFGMQAYIVNGVRSKSARSRIALYQPMTLLDLVVYHKENAGIMRIKEIKCLYPYQSIPTDVRKSTIAMFLNEMINKTIKEESHAQELCQFLIHSFMALDRQTEGVENFHLLFLLKLSRHLGFGAHTKNEVVGGRFATEETEGLLETLIKTEYDAPLQLTNLQRRELLELILKFYTDHIETIGEVKSLPVLREVLN
ncbi:DNA repair protein RecO [Parachryseolinea silvisoli]|jgi:DNA repair protein RecO (recombination protein O)|uniref:DNA repair protein RecO n=1 Tax=Parachryseolinea silvisoli TaxID=2873601 RepID=UPI002265B96F|nr:DNA repair protein RecO [Parachryseolinea silvisoli]MCD9016789.1 DNA repair protein RecO [Parachryseolinea silvisoli]